MATVYRIHPAIGIARRRQQPGRVLRRAGARRRAARAAGRVSRTPSAGSSGRPPASAIFAHHDDGSVEEITDAEADITWTVHLVNAKAGHPGRGNSEPAGDLTIDPGSRTLTGPDQQQLFDTGLIHFSGDPLTTVPLGEIRSDDENHLLVLGGLGTSGSPAGNGSTALLGQRRLVRRRLRRSGHGDDHAPRDNSTPAVVGAWVIVAPPKFAPHQDNVITLYDRVLQAMVDGGLAAAPDDDLATRRTSIRSCSEPATCGWVDRTFGAHTWPDPVSDPATTDRDLQPAGRPARWRQHAADLRLRNAGRPLDPDPVRAHAALEGRHQLHGRLGRRAAAAGRASRPTAWTARRSKHASAARSSRASRPAASMRGDRPIIERPTYIEPFRLDHAVAAPGTISVRDGAAVAGRLLRSAATTGGRCRGPNDVIPPGRRGSASIAGTRERRHRAWSTSGTRSASSCSRESQHVEVERCDTRRSPCSRRTSTSSTSRRDRWAWCARQPLAITFEVISPGSARSRSTTRRAARPTHPQLVAVNTIGHGRADHRRTAIATARLWVIYRTSTRRRRYPAADASPCSELRAAADLDVTIDGNTVARKTAAAALVLDRSGSMSEDRGDGQSKHASLQQAASIFVDVMLEGDGVGLVRYNQDAQAAAAGAAARRRRSLRHQPQRHQGHRSTATALDPVGRDLDRRRHLRGRGDPQRRAAPLRRQGAGRADRRHREPPALDRRRRGRDQRADLRRRPRPRRRTPACRALQTISGNNGGFLLVTGAIGTDNRFLLQKYFLQILAGISNAEVVLDPDGELIPGAVHRIPFQLTDADAGRRRDPAHPVHEGRRLPAADAERPDHRAVARDDRAGDALSCWSDRCQLLPPRAADRAHARSLRPGRHVARAADDRAPADRAGRRSARQRSQDDEPRHPRRLRSKTSANRVLRGRFRTASWCTPTRTSRWPRTSSSGASSPALVAPACDGRTIGYTTRPARRRVDRSHFATRLGDDGAHDRRSRWPVRRSIRHQDARDLPMPGTCPRDNARR